MGVTHTMDMDMLSRVPAKIMLEKLSHVLIGDVRSVMPKLRLSHGVIMDMDMVIHIMDMVIMEKQLHASMVMVPQFLVPCQLLLSLLLNARSAMPKQRLILGDIMV